MRRALALQAGRPEFDSWDAYKSRACRKAHGHDLSTEEEHGASLGLVHSRPSPDRQLASH